MDKFITRCGVMPGVVLAIMLTACTPLDGHKHEEDDKVAVDNALEQPKKLNVDSLAAVISARHPALNGDEEEDIDEAEEFDDDSDEEFGDEEEDVYGFDYDLYPTVKRHATITYHTSGGLTDFYRTVDADVYIQGGNITKVDFPRGIGYPSGTAISSSRYDGAGHYRVYTYGGQYDVAVH